MTDLSCAAWSRKTQCIRSNGIPSLVHMALASVKRVQHTQHSCSNNSTNYSLVDLYYQTLNTKTNLQGLTQSTQLTSVV